MHSKGVDLSVFKRFNFARQPVGVKFLFDRPPSIKRLEKKLTFCQMLPEAQKGRPFYTDKDNHRCFGTFTLGMVDIPPFFSSGSVASEVGEFDEARTGRRVYFNLPKLDKGSVNYVAFAPLDKLSFNPDVLICTGTTKQAEILLRASSYKTGKMWVSKTTAVLGCAWLYVYPFMSGEVNYMVMGMCAGGMIASRIFPTGVVMVSIPFDQLSSVTESLAVIPWTHQKLDMNEADKPIEEMLQQRNIKF